MPTDKLFTGHQEEPSVARAYRASDDLASAGRSLEDTLAQSDRGFKRWLSHKFPVNKASPVHEAASIELELIRRGYTPRYHKGHEGRVWKDPHLTVDELSGVHIPVVPEYGDVRTGR